MKKVLLTAVEMMVIIGRVVLLGEDEKDLIQA